MIGLFLLDKYYSKGSAIFAVSFGSLIAHSPGREFFAQLPEILQNSDCYSRKSRTETSITKRQQDDINQVRHFQSTAHLVWFVSTL